MTYTQFLKREGISIESAIGPGWIIAVAWLKSYGVILSAQKVYLEHKSP